MTILYWIFLYAVPTVAAVYVKDWRPVQKERLLIVHTFLLLSILLMSVIGIRLEWNFQILDLVALVAAVLMSAYFIGPMTTFVYVIASAIQETWILLAATLLIPTGGIFIGAAVTSLMYTFAHRSHPSEIYRWRWKYGVLFAYGVISVLLYVWLHQPLLNIALHTVAGSFLFYEGFLLTQTKIVPLRRNK